MKFKGMMRAAAALVSGLIIGAAQAQLVPPVDVPDVNLVGAGIGSVPDYMGSSNNKGGLAPVVRYQLAGTQRYFLLLGSQAYFNVLDNQNWRVGPMLNYRFGRDSDVSDFVVKRMVELKGKAEIGAFVQYNHKLSDQKMHQLVFSGDIGGSDYGTVGNVRMMLWQPLSQSTLLNIGIGMQFANDKWMNTYFGVTNPADVALYPTLAGTPYVAGSGMKSFYIPFGVTQALSKEWLVSVGGRYESLQGNAKASPVVSQRGKADQWIYGLGVSYLF